MDKAQVHSELHYETDGRNACLVMDIIINVDYSTSWWFWLNLDLCVVRLKIITMPFVKMKEREESTQQHNHVL